MDDSRTRRSKTQDEHLTATESKEVLKNKKTPPHCWGNDEGPGASGQRDAAEAGTPSTTECVRGAALQPQVQHPHP